MCGAGVAALFWEGPASIDWPALLRLAQLIPMHVKSVNRVVFVWGPYALPPICFDLQLFAIGRNLSCSFLSHDLYLHALSLCSPGRSRDAFNFCLQQ